VTRPDYEQLAKIAEAVRYRAFTKCLGGVAFSDDSSRQDCYVVWGLPPEDDQRGSILEFIAAFNPTVCAGLLVEVETLRPFAEFFAADVCEYDDECPDYVAHERCMRCRARAALAQRGSP